MEWMDEIAATLGYYLLLTNMPYNKCPCTKKYVKSSLIRWPNGWMGGWNSANAGLLLTYLLLTNMP
jgi:hypothetical protein